MINQLKSSNVTFSYTKKAETQKPAGSLQGRSLEGTASHEIGQTKTMYSFVQQRDFASSVLPTNANANSMKPTTAHVNPEIKSINQSMFRWNNINIT